MTSGRAVLSDTTVARAGWASIVLGLVLVILIQWTWPGVGVFDVVPEAVAGLTGMALGIIAIGILVWAPIRLALAGVWYVWRNVVVAWGDRWVS